MKKYTVGAYKEYETQHGIIAQEQVYSESFTNATRAEEKAEELYKEGGHNSIYITFNHPLEAQCYYNQAVGHNSTGDNWVTHFESMVDEDE